MITVIVGPTGIGKTRLSIALAKQFNSEIINADSVQIYSEPCIGTAKITKEEMEGIPHHLIGTKSLREKSTIYEFQKEGRRVLDKLISKNKNIIIVGGSGLYLKALLYDYELNDEEIINNTYDDLSNEELKEKVNAIYKDNNIDVENRKRLLRFLNHYESTGKIIKNTENKDKKLYNFKIVGLNIDRNKLYEIIDRRVDSMINMGLIKEAETLYKAGYPKLDMIIGYKELIPYFKNEISLEEAISNIKRDTRKFSKRQYTWYNNQMKDIKWFDVDLDNFESTIKEVTEYIS